MGGFKVLGDNIKKAEIEKVGRGNTETIKRERGVRSEKVLLNLTKEEMAILKEEADKLGMSYNVYCRFKIFNS